MNYGMKSSTTDVWTHLLWTILFIRLMRESSSLLSSKICSALVVKFRLLWQRAMSQSETTALDSRCRIRDSKSLIVGDFSDPCLSIKLDVSVPWLRFQWSQFSILTSMSDKYTDAKCCANICYIQVDEDKSSYWSLPPCPPCSALSVLPLASSFETVVVVVVAALAAAAWSP